MPTSHHVVAPNKGETFFLQPYATRLLLRINTARLQTPCATVGATVAQGIKTLVKEMAS